MAAPRSVPELRRFLGMVNQLGKFTPHLAELTQPLRELLSKNRSWIWGPSQSQAFKLVKQELTKPTVLTLYDPNADTKVSADASSHGLGAVLLQKVEEVWKPVAYASRSMSDTEKRYAQIEKEALATTWACEKFSMFILGKHIEIETDHKPLVPLLGVKHLDTLPPRVLRFRLRLDRFNYTISHVPGKELYTADTLSRAPIPTGTPEDDHTTLQELAELCVLGTIENLPANNQRLNIYRKEQTIDPVCKTLFKYCENGWPNKGKVDPSTRPYWEIQDEISVGDGLLMRGARIIVPKSLQRETLGKLHTGHQGIVRCRLRAKTAVWWPGLATEIKQFISKCPECSRDKIPSKEPLVPDSFGNTPRSHIVQTRTGQVRRNRSHLNIDQQPTQDDDNSLSRSTNDRSPIQTRTRTGTPILPPERLI